LNGVIDSRNRATPYLSKLLDDGILGEVDTGFNNVPSKFGDERREFVQRNTAIFNSVVKKDTNKALNLVDEMVLVKK